MEPDAIDAERFARMLRRLDELGLRALEAAIEADLRDGHPVEALLELESLMADPLRERLHAQRMLALYRSGRYGAGSQRAVCAARDSGSTPSSSTRVLGAAR